MMLRRINCEGDPELDYVMTDCDGCGKLKKLIWECEDYEDRDHHGKLYCKECGDAMVGMAVLRDL
jgi:hypothetical protein